MKTGVSTHVTAGWVKALLFLLVLSQVRCDVLDLFRESCPYNKFCTMDRLSNTTQEKVTSCCLDCFCDEACHAYGDCCPDIHSFEPMTSDDVTSTIQCDSTIVPTEYLFKDHGVGLRISNYRMFDSCPNDYMDSDGIVEKCEEGVYGTDRSLADAVMVSGPNNVIYRNNFCALCHGETDVIRWSLKLIICRERLTSVRLQLSEMEKYIIQNCVLESVPPTSLPFNNRLLLCRTEIISECNMTSNENLDEEVMADNSVSNETVDETVIRGCESGPYMPFSADLKTLYKNALCYLCNEGSYSSECIDGLDVLGRSPMGTFTRLLDTFDDSAIRRKQNGGCGESEIKDYNTDECRTLYCPTLEASFYGSCEQITIPGDLLIRVRTYFWSTDNITITRPVVFYNNSMKELYARELRKRFQDLECPGISVFVIILTEPGTNAFRYLMVYSEIVIDDKKCTVQAIGAHVRRQQPFKGQWLINDEIVTLPGTNSFFRNVEYDGFVEDMLLFDPVLSKELPVDEFIACPYAEFDLEGYNKLLARESGTDNATQLTTLSLRTEMLPGTYALSEDVVAVCTDENLLQSTSSASHTSISLQYLLVGAALTVLLLHLTARG